jgi:hypothetical protein
MDSRIASLSATDPDLPFTPQTFSYSLVPNYGDNLIFYVSGTGLHITGSPSYADYERQSSFAIRLQVTDQGGLSFQRDVTLQVNDLPDTPTYSASQSTSSILEGQSVSFALATTNLPAFTPIYWAISGNGITGSDFSDGLLSGSGAIGADGRYALLRTTVSDVLPDPEETFSLTFFADAARTHRLASPLAVRLLEPVVGAPTEGSDVITGTADAERITGVPIGSTLYGRGSLDRLTGQAGRDLFVLGVAQRRYYDSDSSSGLAIITDFTIGQDKIQLHGVAKDYVLSTGRYNAVNGTFISVAAGGDRIGFVEGLRSSGSISLNLLDGDQFAYVVPDL